MFKNTKRILFVSISFIILSVPFISVSASTQDTMKGAIRCVPDRWMQIVEKEYTTDWGGSIKATNNDGVMKKETFMLSRKIASSFGDMERTNLDLLEYATKIEAELKYPGFKIDEQKVELNLQPFSNVYVRRGTDIVKGKARIAQRNSDCSISYGHYFNFNYGYQQAFEWYN